MLPDRVFGPTTTTRHVYDVAAQHVINGAMEGINGKYIRLPCFVLDWMFCLYHQIKSYLGFVRLSTVMGKKCASQSFNYNLIISRYFPG